MNDLDILQDQLSTTDESQDISQLALSDGYGYGYGYGYNGDVPPYVYRGILMLVHDLFRGFGDFAELVGNIESYGLVDGNVSEEDENLAGISIHLTSPVFFYGGCTYIFIATGIGNFVGINESSTLMWHRCYDFSENGCRTIDYGYDIEIPEPLRYVYYVEGFGITTDPAGQFTWSVENMYNYYEEGEVEVTLKFDLKVNEYRPKSSYFRPLFNQSSSTSIESIMSGLEYTYFNVIESTGTRFLGATAAKTSYNDTDEINGVISGVIDNVLNNRNYIWGYTILSRILSRKRPVLLSYFDSSDKTFITYLARYQKLLSSIKSSSNYYSNGLWNNNNLRELIPVLSDYNKYKAWNHYPIISADYSSTRDLDISTYRYDLYYIKVFITKGGSLLSSSELQNYLITNDGNKYQFVEDSISDYLLYDDGRTNVSPTITLHSSISGDNSSNYTSSGMYFGLLTPETSDTAKTISIGLCDSLDNQVVAEKSYSILKTKDLFNMAYIVLDIPENKSVFVGDIPVHDCFVGDIPVQKIYVGDTQVWARS